MSNSENVPSGLSKMTITRSKISSETEFKSSLCRRPLRDVSGAKHFVLSSNPSMTILTSGCEVSSCGRGNCVYEFTTMLSARSIEVDFREFGTLADYIP
jgi:hypothetical protein